MRTVEIATLSADPANARKHSERNVDAIAASLKRFGQRTPIVIDARGVVRKGNGTLEAAKKLGWQRIEVLDLPLEGAEAAAYAIADNRTAELAEWDGDALAAVFRELDQSELFDDAVPGFNVQEMRDYMADADAEEAGDKFDAPAPLPASVAVSRKGDVWLLGRHRLMCGDSSKWADVERLIEGQPIHLVNTDPPYNVKVEPRSNNAIAAGLSSFAPTPSSQRHHQALDLDRHPGKANKTHARLRAKDRPLANDFVSDDEFDRLLLAWFGNMARALIQGGGFYIWGGYANVANYPPALKASEMYFSQAVIWVKQHPVLTRKDFMGNHEWCFYGWREGAAHRWFGPNNATDVWEVKKVNPQSMVHLTEKPVELAVRAMEYSSQADERVLDLFGGSGSTLMAAEKMSRRARLMELDELYCDVIVRRWQAATGHAATLEGTGGGKGGKRDDRTWADVAVDRGIEVEDVSYAQKGDVAGPAD